MTGIFVIYFACILGYVHGIEQSCPRDSVGNAVYGPGCKYLCHCKDKTEHCDDATGSCMSGCANEWMGPGCQYRDILWGKETRQLQSNNANEAVDGTADTCSISVTSRRPLWWRAWYEQPEIIRGMTIITKEANIGSFSWFKVYVEENKKLNRNTKFQRQELCYEHDGMPFLTTTITVTCVRPLRGNQIRIQLDSSQTQLVLCDVRVFGGRNLAYSKQTSQSSTYLDRNSSYVVDGSTNTANYQTCAFTDYKYNQWTVDLGKVVKVQALELITADNYTFRSRDIILAGVDLNLNPLQFPASKKQNLFFTTDSYIKYLRITRNKKKHLAICEALVFGDCLDSVCGLDCIIPCHCAVFTFDNKVSGECQEGCAAGWTGHGHRCDTECNDGTYGLRCSGVCHCVNNDVCDKVNGSCSHGCAAGWTGDACNSECAPGSYGLGCMKRCYGHCLNNIACDNVRGHCPQGCAAGWIGDMCDKECKNGTYGAECSGHCSGYCLDNDICNNVDGNCPRGCAAGWIGDKCDAGCNDGTYGRNCSELCSGHCVDNGVCDKFYGHCPLGCTAGWSGRNCDAECSHGLYGVNCRENCSLHCKDERMCDKTNGRCAGGCKAGWQGLTCLRECKNGTYGAECSGHCSGHCLENGICDNVDGHCSRGCAAGWKGQTCDTECHDGTYGINCQLNCGHCQNEAFCNRVTGVCDERCKPGWTGSLCNEECSNGTFGMDCSQNCSGHCIDGETCNKKDGHCGGGCVAGWQGNLCDIAVLSVQDFQNNWPLVSGTIVAVLALIGVVFLAVVVYRRFYIPSRWNKSRQEPVPVQPSDDMVERLALRYRICDDADPSRQQGAAVLAKDGCEYYNMVEGTVPPIKMPAHGIHLANLIGLLENEKHRPGKLAAEFAEIPAIAEHSCLEAQKSSNKHKNRYQKMYPYDHNRVILHTVGADPSSDYINASHIDGYTLRDAYIAAQGTKKVTIGDFWRLVWEKKIKVIVVLTELYEEGQVKFERYWDSTCPVTFGDITVTVLSEEQFAEFTIRTFQATTVGNKSPLLVKQYHYTAWPDKACPDGTASLLCFWGRVNKDNPKSDTPWLVHCSAGVGRTGTFIALDILISQGRDTGYVDVYGCVEALRQQRVFMVQTKGQYIYLHELLADALVLHSLPVSTDEFLRLTSSRASAEDCAWNALTEHMMVGDDVIRSDSTSKSGMMPENIHKNRFESIVPDEQYRPYLLMTSDGGSNYINAVYMPSYRRKHGFILTQTPLPTTTADWWRLIYQHKIHTVLAFDDTPTNENVGLCFPMDRKLENGQLQTRQLSFEQDRGFTISKHTLSYEGTSRELTYLHYQDWPKDNIVPFDRVTMLHFCLEVLALQNQHLDSPLLIQCFDGATRSGLVAVLLYALDRLRLEDEVAVLQILHHLRLRRPQIVPNKEQLQFCYEVIRHHLQEGSTYANL